MVLDLIHDGSIPSAFQIVVIVGGGFAQFYKIWQAKAVTSTSAITLVLTIIGCLIWGEYARFNDNIPVLIPQIFAAFSTSITIYQYFLYRKSEPKARVEHMLSKAA